MLVGMHSIQLNSRRQNIYWSFIFDSRKYVVTFKRKASTIFYHLVSSYYHFYLMLLTESYNMVSCAVLLVLMIFVDTFTSELRGIYYKSNKVDISYALDKTFSEIMRHQALII